MDFGHDLVGDLPHGVDDEAVRPLGGGAGGGLEVLARGEDLPVVLLHGGEGLLLVHRACAFLGAPGHVCNSTNFTAFMNSTYMLRNFK